MRLGLSMLFCLNEPLRTALKRISKFEIEHIEIMDEGSHALNSRRVNVLKEFIKAKNLHLTVHAPFADINIASTSLAIRRAVMKRLRKSIRLSAQLKPEYWIFHPGIQSAIGDMRPGLDWKINLKSVRELLSEAEKYGLKIAIENVPDPFPFLLKRVNEFERFYEDLGEAGYDLGLAFDVGHANINGQIFDFIERFRGKIVHTHLHDNDGKSDAHLGIGLGNINWSSLMEALRKANYRGALVIESKSNIKESVENLKKLLSHQLYMQ